MTMHNEKDQDVDRVTPDEEQNSKEQSQIADTLKWLGLNYERADGVCLPRCVLYTHYLDFCKKSVFVPAGAATFGKIVRQSFPNLTTRRLGTRGQSKYHYYGIGIQDTSIYYHSMYSGRGLSRFSESRLKTETVSRKYSLSSKTGTLLPDFPAATSFVCSGEVTQVKLDTFLMMYRTHCQRVLDTIVTSNFEEVQNFLLHFWQGMPKHMLPLLSSDVIVDIIIMCDSILYKVLIDVMIPSTIQDLPDALNADIRALTRKLPSWLDSSLENTPDELRHRKLKVVKTFVRSLRRHTSFIHLAQTAKSVLLSHDSVSQMSTDLAEVRLPLSDKIDTIFAEFAGLLNKQAPLQAYIEWVDNIIERCVLEQDNGKSLEELSASFMLKWSFYTSKFVRDLTLHSAMSFGSFHLMNMTLSEYALLVLEGQQDEREHQRLKECVQKHMRQAEEISAKAKVRSPKIKIHASALSSSSYKESGVKRTLSTTTEADDNQQEYPEVPGAGNKETEGAIKRKYTRPNYADNQHQSQTVPQRHTYHHQTPSTNFMENRTPRSTPPTALHYIYPRDPEGGSQNVHYTAPFQDQYTSHQSVSLPPPPPHPQQHSIVSAPMTPSYPIGNSSHFATERQERPYYPYNFHASHHQSSFPSMGIYWGVDDRQIPPNRLAYDSQIHNMGTNYCDYGGALHHRPQSGVPPTPYDPTRHYGAGDSTNVYASGRQYYGPTTGMLYGGSIPPPQTPIELLTSPRGTMGTGSGGGSSVDGGFMEIANQSRDHHGPPPHPTSSTVYREDHPGCYPSTSRSYIGHCY